MRFPTKKNFPLQRQIIRLQEHIDLARAELGTGGERERAELLRYMSNTDLERLHEIAMAMEEGREPSPEEMAGFSGMIERAEECRAAHKASGLRFPDIGSFQRWRHGHEQEREALR